MELEGKNKLINALLCFRQQRVIVNVVYGRPQGTVVGPLFYFLHLKCNDITSVIESGIRLFADVCVCYREGYSETSERY